ncbi:hypothetical protein OG394_25180 [Kribbella sp. NBC_01245]|uniref:hypothetical protein n=1 Tax=Kribbella sp. NBC_01245 TaxID=2903578 RepID=UPI002E28B6B8|nr:hypothetical protein [Kribbella sp. NBC_01245]
MIFSLGSLLCGIRPPTVVLPIAVTALFVPESRARRIDPVGELLVLVLLALLTSASS